MLVIKKSFFWVVILLNTVILISFQNCGKVNFNRDPNSVSGKACSLSGATISSQVINVTGTGATYREEHRFSIVGSDFNSVTWEIGKLVQGGNPSNDQDYAPVAVSTPNTNPLTQTFSAGTYKVIALVDKTVVQFLDDGSIGATESCSTSVNTSAFLVQEGGGCNISGIDGPATGVIGQEYQFRLAPLANCQNVNVDWDLDKMNGSSGTDIPITSNGVMPLQTWSKLTFSQPGTYMVSVKHPNVVQSFELEVQIACPTGQTPSGNTCVPTTSGVCGNPTLAETATALPANNVLCASGTAEGAVLPLIGGQDSYICRGSLSNVTTDDALSCVVKRNACPTGQTASGNTCVPTTSGVCGNPTLAETATALPANNVLCTSGTAEGAVLPLIGGQDSYICRGSVSNVTTDDALSCVVKRNACPTGQTASGNTCVPTTSGVCGTPTLAATATALPANNVLCASGTAEGAVLPAIGGQDSYICRGSVSNVTTDDALSCVVKRNACPAGQSASGNTCVNNQCLGTIPSETIRCSDAGDTNDNRYLATDVGYRFVSACTSSNTTVTNTAKCEYICDASRNFVASGSSCVCRANYENVNGTCLPTCLSNQARNSQGVCQNITYKYWKIHEIQNVQDHHWVGINKMEFIINHGTEERLPNAATKANRQANGSYSYETGLVGVNDVFAGTVAGAAVVEVTGTGYNYNITNSLLKMSSSGYYQSGCFGEPYMIWDDGTPVERNCGWRNLGHDGMATNPATYATNRPPSLGTTEWKVERPAGYMNEKGVGGYTPYPAVSGDWAKLQLATGITATHFALQSNHSLSKFRVSGSNDGDNWKLLGIYCHNGASSERVYALKYHGVVADCEANRGSLSPTITLVSSGKVKLSWNRAYSESEFTTEWAISATSQGLTCAITSQSKTAMNHTCTMNPVSIAVNSTPAGIMTVTASVTRTGSSAATPANLELYMCPTGWEYNYSNKYCYAPPGYRSTVSFTNGAVELVHNLGNMGVGYGWQTSYDAGLTCTTNPATLSGRKNFTVSCVINYAHDVSIPLKATFTGTATKSGVSTSASRIVVYCASGRVFDSTTGKCKPQ